MGERGDGVTDSAPLPSPRAVRDGDSAVGELVVSNSTPNHVAYKVRVLHLCAPHAHERCADAHARALTTHAHAQVKTNAAERYNVRPHVGIIAPFQEVTVSCE